MQPADTQELQLKTFVMRRLCDGRVWLGWVGLRGNEMATATWLIITAAAQAVE